MLALSLHFSLACLLSLVLTPVFRRVAFRWNCVAVPKGDRWHRTATPLLGGVAIVVSVLLLAAVSIPLRQLGFLMGAGMAIFTVGLIDDAISLKPSTKLVAEIAVASSLVFFGYRLGWINSPALDSLLTIAWIVGLTNAFNMLDNMDGLCAGVALIAGSALLISLVTTQAGVVDAQYLAILLGAVAGFLVYNIRPASVFMGDSGSLFIGLNLAAVAIAPDPSLRTRANILSTVLAPALVLLLPIFDTTLVTVLRIFAGRSPTQGGRDHSSHRLVALGLSERVAVSVLWSLAALGALIGLAVRHLSVDSGTLLAVVFVLAMAIFAAYLAQIRVYDDAKRVGSHRITPLLIDFMYKLRVAEVILDACLIFIAYYAAYQVRFEGQEYAFFFRSFLKSLPLVIAIQLVALFAAGAYRGVWRHFSLMDGVVFARAVCLGTLLIVFMIAYLYRFEAYSRGVFIIYAALLMLLLTGSRASFRLMGEFVLRRRQAGDRLVIYGAGDGGAVAVRELLGHPDRYYRMLGFVDDDVSKRGTRLQGYPVLGGFDALLSLVRGGAVDRVIVSTRLTSLDRLEELEKVCADYHVALAQLHFTLQELVAVS